jgi:hypothetical protein
VTPVSVDAMLLLARETEPKVINRGALRAEAEVERPDGV